jgi:hypothetical protein
MLTALHKNDKIGELSKSTKKKSRLASKLVHNSSAIIEYSTRHIICIGEILTSTHKNSGNSHPTA